MFPAGKLGRDDPLVWSRRIQRDYLASESTPYPRDGNYFRR